MYVFNLKFCSLHDNGICGYVMKCATVGLLYVSVSACSIVHFT